MKIGVYCGGRWYWVDSWRAYPLFRKLDSIGPILFCDGS